MARLREISTDEFSYKQLHNGSMRSQLEFLARLKLTTGNYNGTNTGARTVKLPYGKFFST